MESSRSAGAPPHETYRQPSVVTVWSVAMAADDRSGVEAFGHALDRELMRLGQKKGRVWLQDRIAELTGEPRVSDQTISNWRRGRYAPDMHTVFAIEEALELPPGSLSGLLGYLPTSAAAPSRSVLEAIAMDPALTATERDVLARVYRGLLTEGHGGEVGDR